MKKISFNKKEKIMLILSIVCIFDSLIVTALLRGGFNTGNILPLVIGVLLIVSILFKKFQFYDSKKIIFNILKNLCLRLAIIWLISFVFVTSLIILSAVSNENNKADCLLILGAGIFGEQPSLVLIERLDKGIRYINKYTDTKVIVSGGKGVSERITEAEAMKRYLVSHGVAESSIIKEEKSTSTKENIEFSKSAYEKVMNKSLKSVLIITSDFHMFRTKMISKRYGLTVYGISANTPFYIYPNVFLREYFAIIKSYFVDK